MTLIVSLIYDADMSVQSLYWTIQMTEIIVHPYYLTLYTEVFPIDLNADVTLDS